MVSLHRVIVRELEIHKVEEIGILAKHSGTRTRTDLQSDSRLRVYSAMMIILCACVCISTAEMVATFMIKNVFIRFEIEKYRERDLVLGPAQFRRASMIL